jgi:pSer/pThr/pTyr-binding forkhead associated (FHA) protein
VSDQLLTILKFVLMALVWLFFLRVLRAVWAELKRDKLTASSPPASREPVVTMPANGVSGRPPTPTGPPPLAAAAAPEPAVPTPPPITGNGASWQHLRLSVLDPPELRGRSFDVADDLTVGRSSGCGLCVAEDNFVSLLHARFFSRESKLWIEDLGSTNGTYLNTRRLAQPAPLRSGDRLQMGRTVFEVSQ